MKLNTEANRFLIVGTATVLIDFITYITLVYFGMQISVSKGTSFTTGAVFAYFANRIFTFSAAKGSLLRFALFGALYLATLSINVETNESILNYFGQERTTMFAAFLLATGLSAILNFIGMKYLVFIPVKK